MSIIARIKDYIFDKKYGKNHKIKTSLDRGIMTMKKKNGNGIFGVQVLVLVLSHHT